MQSRLYQPRLDINAIIHTHTPSATSFAVRMENIPVALVEMMFYLHGDVRVFRVWPPRISELDDTTNIVLINRTACLMEYHDALTIGETIEQAFTRAFYLDDAAHICAIALSNGTLMTLLIKD
jgi:ribulose-5-phosphate 4-epimerase/fuculose-1-phosphate aldolase